MDAICLNPTICSAFVPNGFHLAKLKCPVPVSDFWDSGDREDLDRKEVDTVSETLNFDDAQPAKAETTSLRISALNKKAVKAVSVC